jgi:hypothetical protein
LNSSKPTSNVHKLGWLSANIFFFFDFGVTIIEEAWMKWHATWDNIHRKRKAPKFEVESNQWLRRCEGTPTKDPQ